MSRSLIPIEKRPNRKSPNKKDPIKKDSQLKINMTDAILKSMDDRRKSARKDANLKISFRKMKHYLFSGSRVKNISEIGICMPVNINIPVGSLLEVEIVFDEINTSMYALARVVRVDERDNSRYRFDMGLEFLNLTPEKQNTLRDYIHRSMAQVKHKNDP